MEQLELFDDKNPRTPAPNSKRASREWKIVSLREAQPPEAMIQVTGPAQALEYWQKHIANAHTYNPDVECVAVLVLNTKLRVKGHYIVSIGGLNEAIAQPREIFRIAVMAAAHAIVLMHNHPSGEPDPSDADRRVTRQVQNAGELLRISLSDHVIVGHQRYFSFRESGLLL